MRHPVRDGDLRLAKDIGLSIIKEERVPGGRLVIYDNEEEADTVKIPEIKQIQQIINGSGLPKIADIVNEVAARIILVDLNSDIVSDGNYVVTSFESFISVREGEENKRYYTVSIPFIVKVAERLRRKNNPKGRREAVKTYGMHLIGNIIEEFNSEKEEVDHLYPDVETGWDLSHFTNLILGESEITDEAFNNAYSTSRIRFPSFLRDDKPRRYIKKRIERVHERLKIQ